VPFKVEEEERSLTLRLYGVASDINWMQHGGTDSYVTRMSYAQPASDEVTITGDLKVRLFSWTPSADVNGLVIAEPDWVDEKIRAAGPFAEIQQLTLSLELKQLLAGRVLLPEMNVEQPRVRFFRDASGRANWNFTDDKNAPPFRLPPIRHFVIKDGNLGVEDVKRNLTFLGSFSYEENDAATQQQFFGLVGKGQLNHAPFSLDVKGDPLLNISPDKTYAFDAHVRRSDTDRREGLLARPFDLGKLQMAASFAGPDLADLYYLTGLALPNTPPYTFRRLLRNADDWNINNLTGRSETAICMATDRRCIGRAALSRRRSSHRAS
jgi:hypothetical protein